jgi:predicted nucleic acid-binding protein
VRNVLFDTGAFVALLDSSEKKHDLCLQWFKDFEGQLLTTEPVLTETTYLLGPRAKDQTKSIEFILREGAVLIPQSRSSLTRAKELMEKYSTVPMDFADATLVVLAEEAGLEEVFTLDRKGFEIYRIKGRKSFLVHP